MSKVECVFYDTRLEKKKRPKNTSNDVFFVFRDFSYLHSLCRTVFFFNVYALSVALFMKYISGYKSIIWGGMLALVGCDTFQKVDFQEERCKQAPTGEIVAAKGESLRWDFELKDISNTTETEAIRVVWDIDGKTFAAQRVSYQFDKRGEQKITVVMTNRCLMQTTKETTIIVN